GLPRRERRPVSPAGNADRSPPQGTPTGLPRRQRRPVSPGGNADRYPPKETTTGLPRRERRRQGKVNATGILAAAHAARGPRRLEQPRVRQDVDRRVGLGRGPPGHHTGAATHPRPAVRPPTSPNPAPYPVRPGAPPFP